MAQGWIGDKSDIQKYYRKQDYETWSKDPATTDKLLGKHIKYGQTVGWERVPEFKQAWHEFGQAGRLLRLNKKGMKKNVGAMGKNVGKVVVRAKELIAIRKETTAAKAAADKKAAQEGRLKARGVTPPGGAVTDAQRRQKSRAPVRQRSILGGFATKVGKEEEEGNAY